MAADTYDTYDGSYTGQAAVIYRRRRGMIMISTFFVTYLYVAGAQNAKSTSNAESYITGSPGVFNAFDPLSS